MATSTRPYLIRALYEWILDNDLTPYLLVDSEVGGVEVPRQSVSNGKIVLNIAPSAVCDLKLGNDRVSFKARFNGMRYDVAVPVGAVEAILAKESGSGMVFTEEEDKIDPRPELSPRPSSAKLTLKLVK